VLERVGAAAVVADADCDAGALGAILDDLVGQPARLESMGRAASTLGRRDAAGAGARLVEANALPRRVAGSS
jgi:UDP-N-acetylglucosamine:LPS N-acetylglucosamine transferase